jgi:hypothetical protein
MPYKDAALRAASHRRWYEKHHDKVLQRKRDNRRRVNYGVTREQYDAMVEEQGGRCKVCGTDQPSTHPRKTHWCVDHCHTTGRVRGLLCDNCNRGIGLLKDCPEVLSRAAAYLRGTPDVEYLNQH